MGHNTNDVSSQTGAVLMQVCVARAFPSLFSQLTVPPGLVIRPVGLVILNTCCLNSGKPSLLCRSLLKAR